MASNNPTLMYVTTGSKGKKKKEIIEVTGQTLKLGKSGKQGDNTVVLPDIDSIDMRHLLIYDNDEEGGYWLKNIGEQEVYVENVVKSQEAYLKKGEQFALGKACSIMFGDAQDKENSVIMFWNDPTAYEEHEVREMPEPNINEMLEAEIDQARREFSEGLSNVTPSIREVSSYIAKFLRKNFRQLSTVLIYRKLGHRWKITAALRKKKYDKHGPSTDLFKRAIDKRVPLLVKIKDREIEIDNEKDVPSLSIMSSPARRVILIPIIMGKVSIGMLYLDSDDDCLNNKAFSLVVRLCSTSIAPALSGYFKETPEKLEVLKISKMDMPKKWGWSLKVYRDKFRPITALKHLEDLGEARLVFGYLGDDLDELSRLKAYIDGTNGANDLLTHEIRALPIIKRYAKKIMKSAYEPRILEAYITFKYDDDDDMGGEKSKGFGRLKKLRIGKKSEEFENDDDQYKLSISKSGTLYVYLSRGDDVCIIDQEADISNIGVFSIDDFLIVSPTKIPKKLLRPPFDFDRFKNGVKDFLILTRER